MTASRIYPGLPPHGPGQRIGLFGGSFNPPHKGHREASLFALQKLALDRVWWMVSPGNPLKEESPPALEKRLEAAARLAKHPRIEISGAEAMFRTRYTADLVDRLKQRAPATRFVWLMGGDNLGQFHLWERWREIARSVPIAVINRPGHLAAPLTAPAAQALAAYRIDEADAATLADRCPPAWIYLTGARTAASSSALRAGLEAS